MAVGLEEILGSLSWSQKFFRAHLNGIQDAQWDWKPFPACRSIREILVHWAENVSSADTALQLALEEAIPEVDVVQRLMKEASLRYVGKYRQQYANTSLDAPYRNTITVGDVLAGLSGEDNYHAGQIAFIRLATDPTWDWVKAVHQTPEME